MTRESAKRIALSHCKPFTEPFSRWMLPVIANMAQGALIDDLMDVQPMQEPDDDVFYTDDQVGRPKVP